MNKKKILFLINTLSGGGAEKVLVDLVNNLDKNKYEITVQTISDVGVHKRNLDENINYKTIVKKKNKFIRKIFCYLINFILSPKIIYNFFIKSDYDYEVAFLEGIPTKIIGSSTNNNSIKYAWVHIDLYTYFSGHEKIFKRFEEYIECYKKIDKIFCVSNGVKDGFIERFGLSDSVEVIYNPYNDKKIRELSLEYQNEISETGTFKIISAGRLCEQKGYERLLEIHKKLISEGYKNHLYILGEGDKRPVLEKYIIDNDLCNSVTLLGFKTNPYKYIKACDLFVCSSFAEGFSTVVAESTILGVPVVSTDVAGAKEILGDSEYGLVVENNTESLYEGTLKIIKDKNLYSFYKSKAKERSSYFSLKNSIESIEKKLEV